MISVKKIVNYAVFSMQMTSFSNVEITNVSYDPTRELYEQYNKVFAEHWKEKTGQDVEVTQSYFW